VQLKHFLRFYLNFFRKKLHYFYGLRHKKAKYYLMYW